MHQTIDIIVVDILESYEVILSRDWSTGLNGYFTTNGSHLWLPYKVHPNKINVECECYMKHTVTDLNDPNESVMFSISVVGNFSFDTFFGELEVELSLFVNSNEQYELLHTTQIIDPHCNITKYCTKVVFNNSIDLITSSHNHIKKLKLLILYMYLIL